jgi:hypothetical protein
MRFGHSGLGTYISVCEFLTTDEKVQTFCCQAEQENAPNEGVGNATLSPSPLGTQLSTTSQSDNGYVEANYSSCSICSNGNLSVNR